jgi:hypothetical protein
MLKHFKLLVVSILSLCVMWHSNSRLHAADTNALVKGSGCVEAGIEAACLIVHDLKTGENFNLFFNANGPKVDTAIAFEGTVSNNLNTCMEGRAVDVTKWHPIRLHCPQKSPSNKVAMSMAGSKSPCGGWSAWYNVQPGAQKTLHVAGICTFPTSGYSVTLTKHVPPGINPKVYLLELTITPPSGEVSQVVRHVPVHYAEETDVQHESVEILPFHLSVPIKIIH